MTVGNCQPLINERSWRLSITPETTPETFFKNPISTHLKLAFSIEITSCYRNHSSDASVITLTASRGWGRWNKGTVHRKLWQSKRDTGVPLRLLQKRWLSRAHEAAGTRTSMSMHGHPCTQVHTPHMSCIHRPEPSLLLQTDYHMHSPSISPSCPFKAWDSPTEEGGCLACFKHLQPCLFFSCPGYFIPNRLRASLA